MPISLHIVSDYVKAGRLKNCGKDQMDQNILKYLLHRNSFFAEKACCPFSKGCSLFLLKAFF